MVLDLTFNNKLNIYCSYLHRMDTNIIKKIY